MAKRKAINVKDRDRSSEREVEWDAIDGEKKNEKEDITKTSQETLSRSESNRYTLSCV